MVVVSVVGTVLDFASALRILANFSKLVKLGKAGSTIETAEDIAKLESHLD